MEEAEEESCWYEVEEERYYNDRIHLIRVCRLLLLLLLLLAVAVVVEDTVVAVVAFEIEAVENDIESNFDGVVVLVDAAAAPLGFLLHRLLQNHGKPHLHLLQLELPLFRQPNYSDFGHNVVDIDVAD